MIHSMTGFAGAEAQFDDLFVGWELRSVNHRFLDISLRLPETMRFIEPDARTRIGAVLRRGRVEGTLSLRRTLTGVRSLAIDESRIAAILGAATAIESAAGRPLAPFSALDVLRWPGVIDESTSDPREFASAILDLLDTTLARSAAVREAEGRALASLMGERLSGMEANLARVSQRLPEVRGALRQKLEARLAEVTSVPDNGRLEQELVFWAQKLDVSEELDRLATHIREFRRTLGLGDPVGKRLDFLLQEMNREANTLASKSADSETTAAAVELKVLIEQIREQIQNVE
ncbi:MAG: YicC/YloC family endoribonuclease [Methylotetracoccus sp.]